MYNEISQELSSNHPKYVTRLQNYFRKKDVMGGDIEDLVQVTITIALEKSSSFRGESAASTWI